MKLFHKPEAAMTKAARVMEFIKGFAEISEGVLEMQAEAEAQKARADGLCDQLAASEAERLQCHFQIGDLKKQIAKLEAALTQERAFSADIAAAMQRHRST